jgi:putative restriction endonuclease
MSSTQLFIAPCSREHKSQTYEHFQNTVVDGVDTEVYPTLNQTGLVGKVGVWGVVSGNSTHWEKINAGDVVLFYTKSGVYTHLAEVVGTGHDESVGEQLWTTYDGKRLVQDLDEPWPYLIYLSNVQQVDIPASDVHDALGYDMEYPQGFMRPTDDRQQTLIDTYGSLQQFLDQYTDDELSGRTQSISETIGELHGWLDREPPLSTNRNYTETQQLIRSCAFRRRVRELYDQSCAVCGAGRTSPQGTPETEAAHIYPKGRGGSDDLRNGLTLCKLHHWAFDVGWFSIADDHELLVRDARQRRGFEEFSRLDGQPLRLPERRECRPHPKFLRAHRSIHDFEGE